MQKRVQILRFFKRCLCITVDNYLEPNSTLQEIKSVLRSCKVIQCTNDVSVCKKIDGKGQPTKFVDNHNANKPVRLVVSTMHNSFMTQTLYLLQGNHSAFLKKEKYILKKR